MQRRRMPGRCPVCDDQLSITRLHCDNCHTTIEGNFEVSKFSRLTREQLDFLEVFVKCRGNIREVERELGISYPTVRGRLDAVIEALGYRVEAPAEDGQAAGEKAARRKQILDALGKGEISAEDAAKQLRQL